MITKSTNNKRRQGCVAGGSVSIPGERTKLTRTMEATKPVHGSLHAQDSATRETCRTATLEKPHTLQLETLTRATALKTQRSQKLMKRTTKPISPQKKPGRGMYSALIQRTLGNWHEMVTVNTGIQVVLTSQFKNNRWIPALYLCVSYCAII